MEEVGERVSARTYGNELVTRLLDHGTAGIRAALGAGVVMAEAVPIRPRRQTSPAEISEPGPAGPGEASAPLELHVVAAVGAAVRLDPWQVDLGRGPLWQGFEGRVVAADPFGGPDDVPHGLPHVAGLIVTPGEWGGSLPLLLTVYLGEPADDEVLARVASLEHLVSGAVSLIEYCDGQERKADQMLQMTQYRRVVEQAKGLVMAAVGTDGAAAFAVLSRASQHFNVRLRHLAVALVEQVGGAPAEHPDDPASRIEPSEADRLVAAQVWQALQVPAHDDATSSGSSGEVAANGVNGANGSGEASGSPWRG